MRDTSAAQPVTDAFLSSMRPLNAAAVSAHPELRFTKIGVLSQRERAAFNRRQALAFARHYNRPLFFWKHELVGLAASWLTDAETSKLYDEERAGLWGYFVEGAPSSITSNLETGSGIVNGCDSVDHSLTLGPEHSNMTLQDYIERAKQKGCYEDGVLVVQLDKPPLSINVIPDVPKEARSTLIERGASLEANKLVVPILVGPNTVEFTPTSVYAAQAAIPRKLRLRKHQRDLAFAVTDYKVSYLHPAFGWPLLSADRLAKNGAWLAGARQDAGLLHHMPCTARQRRPPCTNAHRFVHSCYTRQIGSESLCLGHRQSVRPQANRAFAQIAAQSSARHLGGQLRQKRVLV